jgi:hypothetical protein
VEHWAQQKSEAFYSLTSVTQLVDLVRFSFVIKYYQAENLNLLFKLEQGNLDSSNYTRKFNDIIVDFVKIKFLKKNTTYLYIMGLRSRRLREDLMSAFSLGTFNCLSKLQLHASRSNLCRLPPTSRGDTHRQIQKPTGPKTSGYSKSSWKGLNKHSEGGRSQSFDKSNKSPGGAFGSGSHGHSNFSLGQKSKLPPREQKKGFLSKG